MLAMPTRASLEWYEVSKIGALGNRRGRRDGAPVSSQDLGAKHLRIGQNRRVKGLSESGRRQAAGKEGLGEPAGRATTDND
jgi:hypothetical protein